MSHRLIFVTRRLTLCLADSYLLHTESCLCPAESYLLCAEFKVFIQQIQKELWGTFHNFEEVFSYVRNKIKMQFCDLAQLGLGNSLVSLYLCTFSLSFTIPLVNFGQFRKILPRS